MYIQSSPQTTAPALHLAPLRYAPRLYPQIPYAHHELVHASAHKYVRRTHLLRPMALPLRRKLVKPTQHRHEVLTLCGDALRPGGPGRSVLLSRSFFFKVAWCNVRALNGMMGSGFYIYNRVECDAGGKNERKRGRSRCETGMVTRTNYTSVMDRGECIHNAGIGSVIKTHTEGKHRNRKGGN